MRHAWWIAWLLGCGGVGTAPSPSETDPVTEPDPAPSTTVVEPSTPETSPREQSVPRCADASTREVATDYGDLRDGAGYAVVVRCEAPGGWAPAERLRMPFHHASRFEWTNLAELPALSTETARAERIRFHFRLVSRQIEPDPERR
ncbi:MAG: hypothetical protein KC619_20200, partial [Myxococcales bacterium]|nr:hypothetical protein [Myxococcales bacterium]